MTTRRPEWVYFAQRADGLIKIGFSNNPAKRCRELAWPSGGGHGPLRLLAVSPGGFFAEQRTHARFDALRISGEWFRPGGELLGYIANAVAQHGAST